MIVLVAGEPAAVLRLTTKQQVYCCFSYHDSTTTEVTLHFPTNAPVSATSPASRGNIE